MPKGEVNFQQFFEKPAWDHRLGFDRKSAWSIPLVTTLEGASDCFDAFLASWRMNELPSRSLTWPLKRDPWKRRFLLETTIFRGELLVLGSVLPRKLTNMAIAGKSPIFLNRRYIDSCMVGFSIVFQTVYPFDVFFQGFVTVSIRGQHLGSM